MRHDAAKVSRSLRDVVVAEVEVHGSGDENMNECTLRTEKCKSEYYKPNVQDVLSAHPGWSAFIGQLNKVENVIIFTLIFQVIYASAYVTMLISAEPGDLKLTDSACLRRGLLCEHADR